MLNFSSFNTYTHLILFKKKFFKRKLNQFYQYIFFLKYLYYLYRNTCFVVYLPTTQLIAVANEVKLINNKWHRYINLPNLAFYYIFLNYSLEEQIYLYHITIVNDIPLYKLNSFFVVKLLEIVSGIKKVTILSGLKHVKIAL